MYVCVYVCLYVCMYVFVYACISQNDNETAVFRASRDGHLEVVKALITAGADLSIASVSTMLVTVRIIMILLLQGWCGLLL